MKEKTKEQHKERKASFDTDAGISIDRVYGPADIEQPGTFPYTRGVQPDMYRSRLWTMRQYA